MNDDEFLADWDRFPRPWKVSGVAIHCGAKMGLAYRVFAHNCEVVMEVATVEVGEAVCRAANTALHVGDQSPHPLTIWSEFGAAVEDLEDGLRWSLGCGAVGLVLGLVLGAALDAWLGWW